MINNLIKFEQAWANAKWWQPWYVKLIFYFGFFFVSFFLASHFLLPPDELKNIIVARAVTALIIISFVGGLVMVFVSESDKRREKRRKESKENVVLMKTKLATKYALERAENKQKNNLVELSIRSYVPSKWVFFDKETGDMWKASSETNQLVRVDEAPWEAEYILWKTIDVNLNTKDIDKLPDMWYH